MTISRLLLKPHIERLKAAFQTIEKALDPRFVEQAELAVRVRKQLTRLDQFLASVASLTQEGSVVPPDWFETYKEIKLELRFAQRKWKLFVSNELRFRRNLKGVSHVSTFAA